MKKKKTTRTIKKTVQKIKIEEAIVVEGRDDEAVVKQAVDGLIIMTHGFGIRKETWELIAKAYDEKGIIILTDPDFSGEEIRRKLSERFPNAKHAYIPRDRATAGDDIGIENARPGDVLKAIENVKTVVEHPKNEVRKEDLIRLGLSGCDGASELRARVAAELGIGMGNSRKFVSMLNGYDIGIEELEKTVRWLNQEKTKARE